MIPSPSFSLKALIPSLIAFQIDPQFESKVSGILLQCVGTLIDIALVLKN